MLIFVATEGSPLKTHTHHRERHLFPQHSCKHSGLDGADAIRKHFFIDLCDILTVVDFVGKTKCGTMRIWRVAKQKKEKKQGGSGVCLLWANLLTSGVFVYFTFMSKVSSVRSR